MPTLGEVATTNSTIGDHWIEFGETYLRVTEEEIGMVLEEPSSPSCFA
jgi:hypothetical protein